MNQFTFDTSIYDSLIQNITTMTMQHSPLILAIDGRCGSGKTTLAYYLSTVFDAAIIHMDNFFLPFERKTPARLAEPGGSIDYERFLEIVIPALQKREPFSYTAYNCQTAAYDKEIEVKQCELIIVEGSYSLHQLFGRYYDLSLFLQVPFDEQLLRLEARCQDEQKFERFKTDWIPMENLYHEKQSVLSRADLILNTGI